MNKNYFIIVLFILVSLTSCNSDFLDTKPQDKYSGDAIWSNKSLVKGFVLDTYKSIIPLFTMNPDDNKLYGVRVDNWTDNVALNKDDKIGQDNIDKFYDDTKNNNGWYLGWNQFASIRKCNMILEKVAKSTALSADDKKVFLAEAHMLRALIYYRQARLYGKYVKIEKVLKPGDELELPRTKTIKDTYDFILNDLKLAAKDLPLDAAAGKLTKGAAYAFTAEAALQGAAYIETGQNDYYQIAKKASEDLFALNKYSLDDDYSGLCSRHDHAISSPEMILGYFKHADVTKGSTTMMQRLCINNNNGILKDFAKPKLAQTLDGWGELFPSHNLVCDYLVKDEKTGEAKKWNKTSQYKDKKTGYVSRYVNGIVTTVDAAGKVTKIENKYRDKRFYASIVYDSCRYFSSILTIRVGGNSHWNSTTRGPSTSSMTRSGYWFRKGVNEKDVQITSLGKNHLAYHYNIMRLGRAYLNYAEVMLRLNQPNVAIDFFNKTREHHGGLPGLAAGLPIAEVWKWYKIERRVELVLENDRYWSLLRWGKTDGPDGVDKTIPEMNKGMVCYEVAADGKSAKEISMPANASSNVRRFTERRYLFPVPEGERQRNPKLDQNPGW